MELRKQEEIAFHDKLRERAAFQRWSPEAERALEGDSLWRNFKYYSIERHGLDLTHQWLQRHCPGATVLDYCCGNGDDAIHAARYGARKVYGIDISDVSIQNCRRAAAAAGVSSVCEFMTMDAEALQFEDNSFDLIVEYGVLHHLDLPVAMSELARVLKPGGVIICTETLAHNRLIARYRRRTPELRTAWEVDHIIGRRSFEIIGSHFAQRELHFFHLATLAAVPFRRSFAFPAILAGLRALDRLLLQLPGVRWQAWQCVFKLSQPVKVSTR
jgi:SAM-dependent methyltransferase